MTEMTKIRMMEAESGHISISALPKAEGRDEKTPVSLGFRDPAHFTSALSSARRSVTTRK